MLEVGSVVAGYRIERVLGSGGMGTVYLAKHPTLPRRDALKVLNAELSHDAAFRERFAREADVASLLDHPNIVAIYGRDETEDGLLWIALQYVDGTDAEEALRAGAMTPQRAIHLVEELAKALDYAHRRDVVHHDVKPANVLLSGDFEGDERVLITDFGVAQPIGAGGGLDGEERDTATTLAYAAPEALAGEHVDGRADLYAAACTLFRLLTGRAVFDTDGAAETIRAHLEWPVPRVSDHLEWATTEIDEVFAKALAKDPAHRHSSVREFAADAGAAVRRAGPPRQAVRWHGEDDGGGGDGEGSPQPRVNPAASPPPAPSAPPAAQARSAGEGDPAVKGPARAADTGGDVESGERFGELPEFKAPVKARPQIPTPLLLAGVGAVVAVIVVTVAIIGLVGSSSSSSPPVASTPPPTSAAKDPAAQQRLVGLLPVGYAPGVCREASIPAGAVAVMSCGPNGDAGGPTSATFTLVGDIGALRPAFDAVIGESDTVVCPGNIQSPGPWKRRANPGVAAGTLYCGLRGNSAVIAWTTDDELLLNVVRAERRSLPDLYRWWASHS